MHRGLTPWCWVVALGVAAAVGCTSAPSEKPDLREPARVERLRVKITKVQNAIEETRRTIARSQGASYLPKLYLRLAELLSEQARYRYKLAGERQQSTGGVSNVPQVRLLKKRAIGIYEMMNRRFEGSDLIPRALYNLGFEHRELGNFGEMQGAFRNLIENHPESSLADDARLALGDHYFDRSKLQLAGRFYRQIARGRLDELSGVAHYKLGWVQVNEGECGAAIQNFEQAIRSSNRWAERSGGETEGGDREAAITSREEINVRREALVDLTYCYTQERRVDGALEYFENLATTRDAYVAAVDELAHRYRLSQNYRGLLLATREVLRLGAANRDRLENARSLYSALKNREDFRRVGADLERMAETYRRFYAQAPVGEAERERLRDEFEDYLRDIATRAQTQYKTLRGDLEEGEGVEDIGRPPVPVETDELGPEVIRAYRVYLDTFPRASARPQMTRNLSDALASDGRKLEAGKRALEAAGMLDEGEAQKNALYDAVVYFQESLEGQADPREFRRVSGRASLRRASRHLLTYDLSDNRDRRVKFAVAQTYFNEGRYLRAIDQLTAVAYEYPDSQEADGAIQLVLDAYDTLNDYDGLRFASQRFLDDDSPASKKLRTDIQKILQDAQQRKLDELSLKAAGDEGGDLSPLLKFADQHKGEELGERSLINAFVAARAMGATSKMYGIAQKIASQYPESDQLPGIYTTVAKVARGRFEFDKAIRFIRRAAELNPERTVDLLTAVGEIYEQMGMASEAENQYESAVEAASGRGVDAPLSQLADLLERHKSAEELVDALEPYSDTGNPEVLSRLGLAYVAVGKTDRAESLFERVLEGGAQASAGARTRAQYGVAETIFRAVREFPALDGVETLRKFISLVEVGQQKYVSAARQGSSTYAAASLSRLSGLLSFAEEKLKKMEPPSDLSSAQRSKVEKALKARVEATRSGAEDAIETCKNQVWENGNFTPVVRKCLRGEAMERTIPPFDTIRKGSVSDGPSGLAELRQRISKNPKDTDALKEIGDKMLSAGNAHAARVVFAQAVKSGGGARARNALGVARNRIGDTAGAFAAFRRAAQGGLEAGRQNLASVLETAGFSDLKQEVLERFSEGESGGRTIGMNPRGMERWGRPARVSLRRGCLGIVSVAADDGEGGCVR